GFFPRYNRLMAEHGFAEEAAAIAEAWLRGDREAAERAVSDAMIDASSIAGTPEECCERIEAYRQSGIDLPILSPFARGPGSKARFEAVIRACAPVKNKISRKARPRYAKDAKALRPPSRPSRFLCVLRAERWSFGPIAR